MIRVLPPLQPGGESRPYFIVGIPDRSVQSVNGRLGNAKMNQRRTVELAFTGPVDPHFGESAITKARALVGEPHRGGPAFLIKASALDGAERRVAREYEDGSGRCQRVFDHEPQSEVIEQPNNTSE